jgi:hypothetical protein
MSQFPIPGNRPTPSRPRTPKARPTTPGALAPIEEKDGEVDVTVSPAPAGSSFSKSPTELPFGKERFLSTPSEGDGPLDRTVVMDKFGFPLSPQPLDDPRDPLTWSPAVKIRILIQISLLSFLSLFTAYAIVSICLPRSIKESSR